MIITVECSSCGSKEDSEALNMKIREQNILKSIGKPTGDNITVKVWECFKCKKKEIQRKELKSRYSIN